MARRGGTSSVSGKRNEVKDERVKLPLDPETALRALLAVDPDDEPAQDSDGQRDDLPRGGKSDGPDPKFS
jgi:hypothetical protein